MQAPDFDACVEYSPERSRQLSSICAPVFNSAGSILLLELTNSLMKCLKVDESVGKYLRVLAGTYEVGHS